jgi:site-specific DNA-methyltransferase (adenine-specific)
MAELQLIDIDLIDAHPKNPRVVIREDVVSGISSQIKDAGGYQKQHAIHVRPTEGGRFQVVSGHHRRLGAIDAKCKQVWCWVEEMDDETAFMLLVLANNQGELDPLEIGIHAFEAVPVARGKKGEGLKQYAERIGKKAPDLTNYRQAGEVARNLLDQPNTFELSRFLGKAQHLAAIHKLPQECWQAGAEWIIAKSASVKDTTAFVDRVGGIIGAVEAVDGGWLFPPQAIFDRCVSTPDFSPQSAIVCLSIAGSALAMIDDSPLDDEGKASASETFTKWCEVNIGGDSWNKRKLQAKIDELSASFDAVTASVDDRLHCGDWRDHIDKVSDASIKLLLIDPPYGMAYKSNRRADKHEVIAADGTPEDAVAELGQLMTAVFEKMAAESHVLCFCRWDSEAAFIQEIESRGYEVKGSLIWVKDSHGSGDLSGAFAPKHERIVHAVKGKPVLYERHADVFEAPKASSDIHPTAKPVCLLSRLIECTTVEGQLVADFFAGAGSTLAAANKLGRDWFGCEINEGYYKSAKSSLGGSNG